MSDCIVVGSGPAGGSAAWHLARRGRSTLVLEKDELPRYKPCGGGVSPQVQEWFDFDFAPAISTSRRILRYTWNTEEEMEVSVGDTPALWMVRRDVFDHFLVRRAVDEGAELWTGTVVEGIERSNEGWRVRTARGVVEARYLIAADGSKGPMARWLGFKRRKRRIAGAIEAEAMLEVDPNEPIHLEFGMVDKGYVWNFPKADGFSLGVGVFRGAGKQDLKGILAEYTDTFGVALEDTDQYGHPVSLWDGDQRLHTDRAVLAGEAACVVDPFTAEGIRPSIFSGMKAAEQIDAALAGDDGALEGYTRTMASEWGREMRWARRLARAFYSMPRVGYREFVRRPSASGVMLRILSGDLRYSEVAGRAIRRLLSA